MNILTWVWLAGVTVFSLHKLVRHRRFVRRLFRNAKPLELPWHGLAAECAATAGLRIAPPLLTVPGSGTPFLCGLCRPRLILPSATLEALTLSEARHVLLHEMLHIRRRDLAANVLLYPRTPWPFGAIANRINHWGIRKGILVTPYEAPDILERFRRAGFAIERSQIAGNCLNVWARKPAVP